MKKTYHQTLYELPQEVTEAWLFEMPEARRQAERYYAEKGRNIKLHSAYKTLLSTVLEQGLLDCVKTAVIRYPVLNGDEPKRFRLECYPLSDLYDCRLQFEAFDCLIDDDTPLPYYEIITPSCTHKIAVPVRWVTKSTGEKQWVACGWAKDKNGEQYAVTTEFEQIYHEVCQTIDNIPLNGSPPFFKTLNITVGLPLRDLRLPVGDEQLSLTEALHEDIYFSALEILQSRLGLPHGSRELTPGQVLPNVTFSKTPYVSINEDITCNVGHDDIGGCPTLATVEHWLTPKQITSHLHQLAGTPFNVISRQGREVQGAFIGSPEAPIKLAISGGQHANESSGVVGALRAAQALSQQKDVALTVCPSENPDGYAAFRHLCQPNPRHMHHAARYTAAGNDLTYGDSHESLIRSLAKQHLLADVHLNLHGYPSHEWTRPLSGYVPSGFATWTIPKGFFLICRYNKGYQRQAQYLLDAAIAAIIAYEPQRQQNQTMLNRYLDTVGEANFSIRHAVVPFMINESENTDYPIEIITEAPDETIYGESFRIAHESHYRVIMAIAEALHRSYQKKEEKGNSRQ